VRQNTPCYHFASKLISVARERKDTRFEGRDNYIWCIECQPEPLIWGKSYNDHRDIMLIRAPVQDSHCLLLLTSVCRSALEFLVLVYNKWYSGQSQYCERNLVPKQSQHGRHIA